MAGTVSRGTQSVQVNATQSVTQGVGSISGSSTLLDGTEQPYTFLVDENNPSRKVSPAGDDTLTTINATLTGGAFGTADSGYTQQGGGANLLGAITTIARILLAAAAGASGALFVNTRELTAASDVVTVVQTQPALAAPTNAAFGGTMTLTANADNSLTFAARQSAVYICNSTGATVYVWPDAAMNQGGIPVPSGPPYSITLPCTTLHVYATTAAAVNQAAAGGLIVAGVI